MSLRLTAPGGAASLSLRRWRPFGSAGRRELDLPLGALDLLDADRDPVAEPERPPSPAAGQCSAEVVDLEVVAPEPPGGEEAFEDLAEADEETRADEADDLALPLRLPAALEELVVEEPGEAELVR